MSWNVPDDWNSYWRTCSCGARYHASEGGCSNSRCEQEDSERPWLEESGYEYDNGDWTKLIFRKVRVCRKNHRDGKIFRGQKYIERTFRTIEDSSGVSWLTHSKKVLK